MNGTALTGPNGGAVSPSVIAVQGVSQRYGKIQALQGIDFKMPMGEIAGVIGPDGAGKSSLFSLLAGARAIQTGTVEVLGGSMADAGHRLAACPRIAYMPQGLGRNLYPTLSVFENLDFFGRLFGQGAAERASRIEGLLRSTDMTPFRDRAAGNLSGGMKQKLGLCCALIHDPDLLLLDEPTTGVDPLSRVRFWELVGHIRAGRPGMSVLVATAYMDEAARFDRLVAMDGGRILATGTTAEILARTGMPSLEEAFITLLPEDRRRGHVAVVVPPRPAGEDEIAIEARGLTMRFGDFTAVDHVGFCIARGEIFGFLGSNGCGKSTTMKMLTGLLPATEGTALLFGKPVAPDDLATRRRVGYMSQAFSLYSELTVRQNLVLHARLFHLPPDGIPARVDEVAQRYGLADILDELPGGLPLGQRQRLSLAVAVIHRPDLLILDEPTSGVDPVARDSFWESLIALSREDRVTIFISTHFMNEAARCDRISLMHAGRVLVTDTPAAIVAGRRGKTLEAAFIDYLKEADEAGKRASGGAAPMPAGPPATVGPASATTVTSTQIAIGQVVPPVPLRKAIHTGGFSPRRMFSYARRESLELRRDPIRATMALAGSLVLMVIMSFGISLDVQDLPFAVLDRDGTTTSRNYELNFAGSRYFIERAPVRDYDDLDRRMRDGELEVVLEIPPGFARDIRRGRPVAVGAWVDGSMPQRAETARSYVGQLHAQWLGDFAQSELGTRPVNGLADIEIRYRYNPDVISVIAIAPAVIPLLMLLIPAMLTALSVVREKELGSIVNLYVTPVTRTEFLIGKQLPYIAMAMVSFALMMLMATLAFGVPFTGSLLAMSVAALLFSLSSTAIGLLMSTFVNSQIAAIFATAIVTLLPAMQFCGLLNPVQSLTGAGRVIGTVFPVTYFLTVSRGTFSKGLGFQALQPDFLWLLATGPVLVGAAVALLRKQDR